LEKHKKRHYYRKKYKKPVILSNKYLHNIPQIPIGSNRNITIPKYNKLISFSKALLLVIVVST
jgi:hypothetical protein